MAERREVNRQMGQATATPAADVRQQAGRHPIDWSPTAARDRLSSTVFLAALFHGILILGVTFGSLEPDFSPATSLDVVIVTRQDSATVAPEKASALAQRNLDGSGNTAEPNQLHTALANSRMAPAIGPDREGATERHDQGTQQPSHRAQLTSTAGRRPAAAPRAAGEPAPSEQRTAMPGVAHAVEIVNEPDAQTLISATGPRELVISASTRESRIAQYLSGWKHKVERIGTLNFPRQARTRELAGNPTLEVAIDADGTLREVLVRQSSGERLLDEAAIEILRLAAPFDPFPEFLRDDYDVLRFAYEWQFGDNPRATGMILANES